jgi:putative selenium metabolism protein SsnA
VMPGFINAHMHFYSTMVRGLGKAKPSRNFQEVLENLWWRLDRRLMLEDCYYSALLPLLDAIRQGTTTLIDHHASPSAITGSLRRIAYAVRETGLRASLCYEVSDRDGVERAEEGIQENIDFIRWSQAEGDDRFRALFGLHAAFTLSDATLDRAARTAADLGVGCHIHTAEAQSDQEFNQERYGLRVVERLHRHGVLGPNSIAAHCVHVNDRELELLAETGTAVVHNPQSNLNNAVGIADILSMNHKGVLVGLGTDAMTVNMREEVRVALWAQHLRHDNPSVGFVEALSTLLFHNARIAARYWDCGLGELKEGHAADVVLIDYIPPTPLDESTFLGHFAFGISQAPVDTTIAGGRVLMAGKQLLLDIDEEAVCRRSRELAADLWERF